MAFIRTLYLHEEDVRIRGVLLKPKWIREKFSLGNTAIDHTFHLHSSMSVSPRLDTQDNRVL
jgi:hypothetical protein